jgi:hypothetical protein
VTPVAVVEGRGRGRVTVAVAVAVATATATTNPLPLRLLAAGTGCWDWLLGLMRGARLSEQSELNRVLFDRGAGQLPRRVLAAQRLERHVRDQEGLFRERLLLCRCRCSRCRGARRLGWRKRAGRRSPDTRGALRSRAAIVPDPRVARVAARDKAVAGVVRGVERRGRGLVAVGETREDLGTRGSPNMAGKVRRRRRRLH